MKNTTNEESKKEECKGWSDDGYTFQHPHLVKAEDCLPSSGGGYICWYCLEAIHSMQI